MNSYKVLSLQKFNIGDYILVPIRNEDRYEIMKWRNEQIYHLRQKKPLSKTDQDLYFNNIIKLLFDQEKPDQILFSLLRNEICIGYGGLVHINWIDKNAEISFVMKTELEKESFQEIWIIYLRLIERIAFYELNLKKIYSYAYDLRTNLFSVLEHLEFKKEAHLKDHVYSEGKFLDVLIHAKHKKNIE